MVEFSDASTVCVVGASGAGKTALVNRLVNQEFINEYVQTIGSELYQKTFNVQEKQTATLDIWCCSGQLRYISLMDQFLEKSNVVIICFDLTNTSSFSEVRYWYDRVRTIGPDAKLVLAGLKSDLSDKIVVTEKDILSQSKEWNADYFPLSSKTEANMAQFISNIVQWAN